MTYLIEFLGEFKFIFETVLGHVSGNQMGYFELKKTASKISRLGTFNPKAIYSLTQDYSLLADVVSTQDHSLKAEVILTQDHNIKLMLSLHRITALR